MRPSSCISILIFSVASVLFSSQALAVSGITYHGRILKPNGLAVDGQFAGFRLRVMDGNTGSCQMYEEIRTKDMRNSNGTFSISIGDGVVPGTYGVSGISLFDELFANDKAFNFNGGHPCVGSPYVADIRDGRILNVSFRESPADPWEDLPSTTIAHVPFSYSSLISKKVGLHDSGSLLRVENAGTPSVAAALTPANFTELLAILNGTTTQYIKSVSATAGHITASTVAGTVSLSLPSIGTAGTYGSATQVPVITTDAQGRVTGVVNTTITGGGGGGITDLTGDVTASGAGSVAATIANNAVTTAKILNANVTDAKLAANSVTTVKILDGNVTLDKLAADSVNSSKIVDNSITGSDISTAAALSVASVSAAGNVGAGTMSTRSMGLFELPGNGTDSITLQAPAALAGSTVYTLPATDGANGDVLSTNSAGVLSWATPGSPGDASYAAKGVVRFDTDAMTSGITVASGTAKIATGGVATGMLADDSVSFAKMQSISTNKLLGRGTAAVGDVEEITLGTGLSFTGTTLNATVTDSFAALPCGNGYLPYKDAGTWTCKQVASANTNDAIITRDSSGNFIAGTGQFSTSVKITDGAAGGQVTIAAPGTFTSYNLTLPTDDGGVDQVLKTNGSGVLSWVNQPTVTGMIRDGGNTTGAEIVIGTDDAQKLSFETGNAKAMTIDATGKVGIGTTSPSSKLSIVDGRVAVAGSGGYLHIGQDSADGNKSKISFHSTNHQTTDQYFMGIQYNNAAGWMSVGGGTNLNLNLDSGSGASYNSHVFRKIGWDGTNRTYTEVARIDGSGNLGIGTAAPGRKLAVSDTTANPFISVISSDTGTAGLILGDVTSDSRGQLRYDNSDDSMAIWTAAAERIRISSSGNMGIGTTTPTNGKLEVKGSIVMDGATSGYVGFQPPTNAGSVIYTLPSADGGNGDVLKTNGSGTLSWTTIAGGSGEANTASNAGVGGVGIYKSKSGVNLDFKNINAGSNKISITDDAGNSEVDIDINEANLTLSNFGGIVPLSKGGTNANITAVNGGIVYSTATEMAVTAAGNNGVLVTSAGGVPSISSTLPNATQDNITRTGTITSGTWSGTTIAANKGGTGQTSYTTGDMLYASSASALSRLAAGSSGQVLRSAGAAAPTWSTATYPNTTAINRILYSSAANTIGEITTGNNGVLVTSGTGVPSISSTLPNATQDNITRTGTITSGTWSATAVAADKGGTGQTAYTVGDILYASTTSALSKLAAGATSGHVLTSNGAGVAPSWQATTIANNAVTTAKIADGAVTTSKIADGDVTYVKMQDVATKTLIGRGAAGTGVPSAVTIGTGLDLSTGGVLTATGPSGIAPATMTIRYNSGFESCPSGWSSAGSTTAKVDGTFSNNHLVCYKEDASCGVFEKIYTSGFPSCPGGWSNGGGGTFYVPGGTTNNQLICYKCV